MCVTFLYYLRLERFSTRCKCDVGRFMPIKVSKLSYIQGWHLNFQTCTNNVVLYFFFLFLFRHTKPSNYFKFLLLILSKSTHYSICSSHPSCFIWLSFRRMMSFYLAHLFILFDGLNARTRSNKNKSSFVIISQFERRSARRNLTLRRANNDSRMRKSMETPLNVKRKKSNRLCKFSCLMSFKW